MDILQALILSAVEGVTEFLPISSTGHLILVSNLLKISQTNFVKDFEIIIQLGSIFAVLTIYAKQIVLNTKYWKPIIIAFIPTAIIGLVLFKFIKLFLIGNTLVTILALFLGGILLIILEKIYKEKEYHLDSIEKISNKQAFLIGLAQSISIIPGVSRAGATILGGLFLGLKRKTATEFSFLLAIPTMLGATTLDLVKSNLSYSNQEIILLLVGFIGSYLTALIVIRWFIKYIQTHNFVMFGVYRIILSLVFWLLFFRG